jgi:hypothetical protein
VAMHQDVRSGVGGHKAECGNQQDARRAKEHTH